MSCVMEFVWFCIYFPGSDSVTVSVRFRMFAEIFGKALFRVD